MMPHWRNIYPNLQDGYRKIALLSSTCEFSMKYFIITLFFNFLFSQSTNYHENNLLFCLDKNEPVLDFSSISKSDSQTKKQLDSFFKSVDENYTIKRWLNAATDNDSSGDIFLNRIYKITFENLFSHARLVRKFTFQEPKIKDNFISILM